jgi:hypothetical protein
MESNFSFADISLFILERNRSPNFDTLRESSHI